MSKASHCVEDAGVSGVTRVRSAAPRGRDRHHYQVRPDLGELGIGDPQSVNDTGPVILDQGITLGNQPAEDVQSPVRLQVYPQTLFAKVEGIEATRAV